MTPPDADKLLPDPPPPEADDGTPPPPAADTPPDEATCSKCGKKLGSARGRANHERTCPGIVDAPPKRAPGRPPKPKLGEKIEGMIGGIGLAVSAFNLYDGQCVIAGAPELAAALEKWGDENPAVRKTLERMVEATTAGAVLLAATKIAIPIAANHGLVPQDMAMLAGVPTPPAAANANANGATG